MMGRRDPQRSLFDARTLPHRVPEDSFYGQMAAVNDVLFGDDDLEEMYCPNNGRPSNPPPPDEDSTRSLSPRSKSPSPPGERSSCLRRLPSAPMTRGANIINSFMT